MSAHLRIRSIPARRPARRGDSRRAVRTPTEARVALGAACYRAAMRWIALVLAMSLFACATEPPKEKIWVLVRDVRLAGVDEPRAANLLATRVRVSPVEGGFVEPRPDLRVVEVEIGKLAGDDDRGRRVNGPVIEGSMRALRRALAESDLVGATVSFLRPDLEALRAGKGSLVLRVDLPKRIDEPAEDGGATAASPGDAPVPEPPAEPSGVPDASEASDASGTAGSPAESSSASTGKKGAPSP